MRSDIVTQIINCRWFSLFASHFDDCFAHCQSQFLSAVVVVYLQATNDGSECVRHEMSVSTCINIIDFFSLRLDRFLLIFILIYIFKICADSLLHSPAVRVHEWLRHRTSFISFFRLFISFFHLHWPPNVCPDDRRMTRPHFSRNWMNYFCVWTREQKRKKKIFVSKQFRPIAGAVLFADWFHWNVKWFFPAWCRRPSNKTKWKIEFLVDNKKTICFCHRKIVKVWTKMNCRARNLPIAKRNKNSFRECAVASVGTTKTKRKEFHMTEASQAEPNQVITVNVVAQIKQILNFFASFFFFRRRSFCRLKYSSDFGPTNVADLGRNYFVFVHVKPFASVKMTWSIWWIKLKRSESTKWSEHSTRKCNHINFEMDK